MYGNLRELIEALLAGWDRDHVLANIGRLDCANPDKALAPCDPAAPPPPTGIMGFQEAASDEEYSKALAGTLKSIVCAGDDDFGYDDSIFVLRSISQWHDVLPSRLSDTGAEAPALIDFIVSPACPASAKLTEDDRAALLEIKIKAPKASPGARSPP